jgi:glycosyltransferase involved in cell wall biosynthesis
MTIKALFVLDQVNRGGTEVQTLDALKTSCSSELEITLVTTGGQLLKEFQNVGEVFVVERRRPIDLSYASQIRRIIKERDFAVVQGHQAVDALHLLIATRGMRDIKRVLTIEGFVPDKKNRYTLRLLIPKMDAVVFPSKALQDWVADRDGLKASGNSVVIANGADPARLGLGVGDIRSELGLQSDAFVVGMIGNFYRDPRKDQLTLIKALPSVFTAYPETHCIVVGGVQPGAARKLADCEDYCRKKGIADRVHFLGSRADITAILNSIDLFVFSSLHEGGSPPIAVIEAMLNRVPVIASDIAPHIEYASGRGISMLFKTGDEFDLAQKIKEVIADHSGSSQMADRAYLYASHHFTAKARLERFVKLYERLLAE